MFRNIQKNALMIQKNRNVHVYAEIHIQKKISIIVIKKTKTVSTIIIAAIIIDTYS